MQQQQHHEEFPEIAWEKPKPKKGCIPMYKVNGAWMNIFELLRSSERLRCFCPPSATSEADWQLRVEKSRKTRLKKEADEFYEASYKKAKWLFNEHRKDLVEEELRQRREAIAVLDTDEVETDGDLLLSRAFKEGLKVQDNLIRESFANAHQVAPNSSVRRTATLPPLVVNEVARENATRTLSFDFDDINSSSSSSTSKVAPLPPNYAASQETASASASAAASASSARAPSSIPSSGGVERDSAKFREARVFGVSSDVDKSFKLPVPFKQLFMDWVISEDIPRAKAMRFIRTLQTELELFGELECDIATMPREWKTMTKLNTTALNKMAPVKKVKDSNGSVVVEYINFGLRKQIAKRLAVVKTACYNYPAENLPRIPHLLIELWTDGVSLSNSGRLNALWPVDCRIIAIGEDYRSEHRYVPRKAALPFSVGNYLAEQKPDSGKVILADIVQEVEGLDPRMSKNEERIRQAGFSVSLRQFAGDLPALAMVKCVQGHTSGRPCFKCRVKGHKFADVKKGIQIFKIQDLAYRQDEHFLDYYEHAISVSIGRQQRNYGVIYLSIVSNL
jgi:hypothetical protein